MERKTEDMDGKDMQGGRADRNEDSKKNGDRERSRSRSKSRSKSFAMEGKIENITELPNEILWEIFGYLSTKDVLRNVAQVSKKFHKLTQDQFLIRKIEVNTRSWYKDAKSEPKTLTEQEREKYCNDLLEVCKRSRKLTFLSLNFSWDEYPMTNFLNALPLMDHEFLEEFCLKSDYPSDSVVENALKYLYQCPNLKILKLDSSGYFSMISKFINEVEHENLEELHFIGYSAMDLEPSGFKKFLETIVGNFPKLQYLYLSFCFYDESSSEYGEICQKIASEKKVKIEKSFVETQTEWD